VFGSGLRHERVQVSPQDSQFIELMQFEAVQASRRYGVPPRMIYAAISGQDLTYQNVGQADMEFLKHSVQTWMVDLEDAWSELIAVPHSVAFDVEGLLALDPMALAEVHSKQLANRTITVNETRIAVGRQPYNDPLYDEPGIPTPVLPDAVSKLWRGVDVFLTSDEAREIANALGGNLPVPGPEFAPAHNVAAPIDGSPP
jgi:hypothetical protein